MNNNYDPYCPTKRQKLNLIPFLDKVDINDVETVCSEYNVDPLQFFISECESLCPPNEGGALCFIFGSIDGPVKCMVKVPLTCSVASFEALIRLEAEKIQAVGRYRFENSGLPSEMRVSFMDINGNSNVIKISANGMCSENIFKPAQCIGAVVHIIFLPPRPLTDLFSNL